ncbi:hypothetical protein QT970_31035 [Microcoleus sp. herbarium8]|uniref:hypothetical protein n=1 Tax=Microcoleus sp. herbarium8 TaxID=3055436 RepID=UPI002FD5E5AF
MTFEKKDRSENFGCSKTQNPTPVSLSLHKSTLDFLIEHSCLPAQGNHLRRLTTFAAMVCSCVRNRSSTLESLCHAEFQGGRSSESCLRQAKRWLCSKWTDWESFYAPYAGQFVAQLARSGELLLVIDGSVSGRDCVTLMISVVWGRYALPLAWVTRQGAKGHFTEASHIELVSAVGRMLPPSGCRVVLLGDGEFDGQRLRACCQAMNWEYVLRTSMDALVDCGGETAHVGELCPEPGHQQVFLPHACQGDNAVLWWGTGHERPVPLLTNMDLGQMACHYYCRRFTIETLFKHFKSAGFQLQKSALSDAGRVQNLILVVAMAFLFTFCMGLIASGLDHGQIRVFARADRAKLMAPITLAQKCITWAWHMAVAFFSDLVKNWNVFFSQPAP